MMRRIPNYTSVILASVFLKCKLLEEVNAQGCSLPFHPIPYDLRAARFPSNSVGKRKNG